MPKICPIYSKYTPKVRPSLGQDMHKLCPRYSNGMPKICPRYAQYMPKIFLRYAQDMPKTLSWFAHGMPKICPRYAQDMSKICSSYVQDMPKIFHSIIVSFPLTLLLIWPNLWLFGWTYDTWLTLALWSIRANLWHVAHCLAKAMTCCWLLPCCIFGQISDTWLTIWPKRTKYDVNIVHVFSPFGVVRILNLFQWAEGL